MALGRGDTIHAVWMDERTGRYRIYYSYSGDYGETWSPDELVDDSPSGMCRFPSIAADEENVAYAVWEDSRAGVFDVYFSKRVDTGSGYTWTGHQKVNDSGSSPGSSDYMEPCVDAGAQGNVYVGWTDWREGVYYQVYFSASFDGGATWTDDARVSDKGGVDPVSASPSLIVDPNDPYTIYCAFDDWRDPHGPRYPEVFFSTSSDGGKTWSPNVKVNDILPFFQQVASRVIGVDSRHYIYVMWYSDDFAVMPQCRVSVCKDGGLSFGPSVRVNDDPSSEIGTYPSLAVDSCGNAFGVWMDYRDTYWNLYFSASADTGLTWIPSVRVDTSGPNTSDYNPIVCVNEGKRPAVIWSYYPTGLQYEINFSKGEEEPPGVADHTGTREQKALRSIDVSPNPSSGVFRVDYSAGSHALLEIHDGAGRTISRVTLQPEERTFDWHASPALGSGVYFFVLSEGREKKVVKAVLLR
jgi:hypothetical protein